MEKYREVQVRDDNLFSWQSGYIFLTKFKGQSVVAYRETSEVMLKPYCRLMPFIPEPGKLIRVSQNGGVYSTRRFAAMDGDLYVCEQREESNGRKVYMSWEYCGGLEDDEC